jgi:outer membrane receptor protein involved in Fe transport
VWATPQAALAQTDDGLTTRTSTAVLPDLDLQRLMGLDLLRGDLAATGTEAYDLGEATVSGRRRDRALPASRFEVETEPVKAVPRKDAAAQLMLAPGVLTTNAGGEGHAHETFLRGFAAGSGQDIEYLVDGVPLNEIGNAHNHGYADILFIPPEVVERILVTNGVFDPEQGDFAFAGTAEYRLGVPERGSRLRFEQGSFNTTRLLGVVAPLEMNTGTFGAFDLRRSDGFGENRSSERASVVARYTDDSGTDAFRWSLSAYGYGARWDQAGVIRQDDLLEGEIGFYDTYDPSQGGESKRLLFDFQGEVGPTHRLFKISAFLQLRDMRIRENFTGFLQDTERPQRGDLNEQRYETLNAGSRGAYELAETLFGHTQELAFGYAFRFDRGRTEQLRLRAIDDIPYDTIFDRELDVLNVAGWARSQIRLSDWLALRGGVRIDTFSFGVRDQDQPTADVEGPRVGNQTISSFGFALSPRVSLEVKPAPSLSLTGSYGQGTRSSDPAALSEQETAPFAVAQEAELGVSWGLDGEEVALRMQGAYVFATVNQDLVFEPAAGRNILVGRSNRHALLLSAQGEVGDFLDALVNVGYTDAVLSSTGERLPYIPELVVRADAALHGPLFNWRVDGRSVVGTLGLGFTFVPGRPLPNGLQGDSFHLLDLAASVRLSHFELGVEARNLLDLQYRQSEFNFTSNFRGPSLPAPRTPQRHFVAGEPFFLSGFVQVHLEDLFFRLARQQADRRPKSPLREER